MAATGTLALCGGALYLISGASWAWWVGTALVLPFAAVVYRLARGSGPTDADGVWDRPDLLEGLAKHRAMPAGRQPS